MLQRMQSAAASLVAAMSATSAQRGPEHCYVASTAPHQQVLDAAYDAEKANEGEEPYVLCIEVQDVPGVLNQVRWMSPAPLLLAAAAGGRPAADVHSRFRACLPTAPATRRLHCTRPTDPAHSRVPQVTGVFARRGYNVQSLAVGNSEREGMSRITMVVPASSSGIANLIKQLNKLVYVEKVGAVGAVCRVASVVSGQCPVLLQLAWVLHRACTPAHPSCKVAAPYACSSTIQLPTHPAG